MAFMYLCEPNGNVDNTSKSRGGGALSLRQRNALNIQESSFIGNSLSCVVWFGSLTRCHYLNLKCSIFVDNIAKYSIGGAIRVDQYNAVNIKASLFAST